MDKPITMRLHLRADALGSTWPAEDTTDPLSMSKWNLVGKEIEGEFRDACFGEEKINGLDLSAKYYLNKDNKKNISNILFQRESNNENNLILYTLFEELQFLLYDKNV